MRALRRLSRSRKIPKTALVGCPAGPVISGDGVEDLVDQRVGVEDVERRSFGHGRTPSGTWPGRVDDPPRRKRSRSRVSRASASRCPENGSDRGPGRTLPHRRGSLLEAQWRKSTRARSPPKPRSAVDADLTDPPGRYFPDPGTGPDDPLARHRDGEGDNGRASAARKADLAKEAKRRHAEAQAKNSRYQAGRRGWKKRPRVR